MAENQKKAKESEEQVYQTGLEVATIVLDAAKNEDLPLRIRTSKWPENFCNLKRQADHNRTKLVQQIKKPFL